MLSYFASDERPAWAATVTVNGVADDMSSGYTFVVKLYSPSDPTTIVLTKSTNITGGAAGLVTVTWAANELAITPGLYTAQLTATRTSDSAEWTITEQLTIKTRG